MPMPSFARLFAAAVLFNFVSSAVAEPPAARETKPAEKKTTAKPADAKPAIAKPSERKPAETKPAEKKAADKKPAEKKTAARKPTHVLPDADVATPVVVPPKPLTPGGKYVEGDMKRPRPIVVSSPTESDQQRAGRPPSDAIILFDGTDLSHWMAEGRRDAQGKPNPEPAWVIKNGYMECVPRGGGIGTKDSFGDCQLHIEWATPSVVKGNSQGRGNSGIMLHGIGEVQVLDSYDNDTYPDGQAAAIYHKYPPLVNASRKPGEWQTYDIVIEMARLNEKTKAVERPLRITVLHNGVVVHHGAELASKIASFRFGLQDHGNPVRYRNIWLRPLKGYDAQ